MTEEEKYFVHIKMGLTPGFARIKGICPRCRKEHLQDLELFLNGNYGSYYLICPETGKKIYTKH
jgi:hypothetical protein